MATQTTRPARTRNTAAAKAAPAKATKAAPAKAAEPEVEAAEVESVVFNMDQLDDTKTYSVFTPPVGSGCVGKLYVPHGAVEVKVKITGPKS